MKEDFGLKTVKEHIVLQVNSKKRKEKKTISRHKQGDFKFHMNVNT